MAQGRYKFEDRRHAGGGVTATVCSGISAGIFAVMAVICMLLQGQGGTWIGGVSMAGFVLAFGGMVAGLKSFRRRSRSYTLSKVGTLLGGFMVAVWFIVFCLGLA